MRSAFALCPPRGLIRQLALTGDFTNYWENGRPGKVVGEVAIFRQQSAEGSLIPPDLVE